MPASRTGIGSGRPITPVEATSTCSGWQPKFDCDELGHAPGVGQPLLAGAGVGVAGADDDRAGVGPRQPLAADLDRRGTDAVLREDAGRGGRAVADDDGEIAPVRFGPQAR